MNPRRLLAELRLMGIHITAADDRIKLKGPRELLTDELCEKVRNAKPRLLALLAMPSAEELVRLCRRAVADYPTVDPGTLLMFLCAAEMPEWCTDENARHIARRMSEGLIIWNGEQSCQ